MQELKPECISSFDGTSWKPFQQFAGVPITEPDHPKNDNLICSNPATAASG